MIFRHIYCTDDKEMHALQTQIETNIAENNTTLEAYGKPASDGQEKESLEKLTEARAKFKDEEERILTASYGTTNLELSNQLSERAKVEMLPLSAALDNALDECLANETNAASRSAASMEVATHGANVGVVIRIFCALGLGSVLSYILISGRNKVLNGVTASLQEGATQIAAASGEVASSSQSLAEGSSEQAASLEETSASLEEMASMTKRNAEHAHKANGLAKEARDAAEKGSGDMQTMAAAMDAIKVSSDDIAKIIQTIDEIAFQTNILALNAAVEAARAGEAAMGFAVVADEVRNLAQRCAGAARETAGKIEGAISKAGQGVDITNKVAMALNEIVTKVRLVDELITEVAGASREQTDGITQINMAVGQMDKVTQSNAANAEESAAASQELSAQAAEMKRSVAELLQLVSGMGETAADAGDAAQTHRARAGKSARAATRPAAPFRNGGNGNGHTHSRIVPATKEKQRSEIPMAGDFKDF